MGYHKLALKAKDPLKTSKNASKWNHLNRKTILEAKEMGLHDRHCAQAAGIAYETLKYWLAKGELQLDENGIPKNHECEYGQFWVDFQKAGAKGIIRRHKTIENYAAGGQVVEEETYVDPKGNTRTRKRYAPPQWQGLAWITERAFPEYSNRQIVRHEGQVKQEITFVIPDSWRGNPSHHTLPAAQSEPLPAVENQGEAKAIESPEAPQDPPVLEGSLVEHGVFE